MESSIQLLAGVLSALIAGEVLPPHVPEPERVVVERLVEREVPGKAVWLEAEGRPFLALHLVSPHVMPQGAVILVHGFGAHPDWPDVIAPLRRALPDQGWSTLSIQLPRLSPEVSHAMEAELPRRSAPRIQAAVAWLAEQGLAPVAVIGHGFGAAVAARHLAASSHNVSAFVAVSLQMPAYLEQAAGFPGSLAAVNVPVLDVYAAADAGPVLLAAPERELWGRKNRTRTFDRIVIEDAGAEFHGREEELARRITAWLVANANPPPQGQR